MKMSPFRCLAALSSLVAWTSTSWALDLELHVPEPTPSGEATLFSLDIVDGPASTEIRWDFGDGTEAPFEAGATAAEHTYAAPGHYTVTAVAQDNGSFASTSFVHTVYGAAPVAPARTSTPLLLDAARNLLITANEDNGTISLIDTGTLEKRAEIPVFEGPVAIAFAPDGHLWVVHRQSHAVGIVDLDAGRMVDFFRLPYASQPIGLVFSTDGDAFIPLYATGEVVRIDGSTHEVVLRRAVTPFPRGITLSGDGADLWVTRFISQGDHGEVFRLDPDTLEVRARIDLMQDTTTEDTDHSGRGLPNYLFSFAITPDGRRAWVPSKKDNILRGLKRDGLALTQDNAVRPLISLLDLTTNQELVDEHIDIDDRNLPRSVTFSPYGDWAFVSVYGSNLVELRDSFDRSFVATLRAEGLFGPVATLLDDQNRLFVLADLGRKVIVFDVADLLLGVDLSTRVEATIPLVDQEKLPPIVLRGKQIFANAEDKRMTSEGYVSCDSCHFEGFEDGLVWDFFDRGEGFRNTTSLLGRRGTGHGRVHWSANFDEIQDFDNPIRAHQGGLGFITAEKWATGTVSEPLGDPKAGLDADLDAMATYVTSLAQVAPSPFRNADGTLTAEARAGEQLFIELDCDSCHSGKDFTDSIQGVVHDVGTMTELSGSRLGGELTGIDTPTLLGIWQTAPYLHDGSAPTLLDVLTTRNPADQHGVTSDLSSTELEQLVAYLQQIDHGLPVVDLTLPGEPAAEGGAGGMGGDPSTTGGMPGGIASGGKAAVPPEGTAGMGAEPTGGSSGEPVEDSPGPAGCGCSEVGRHAGPTGQAWWALGALAFALARTRRTVDGKSVRGSR
jgi:YVTN family beta-propeller protein